MRHVWRVRGPVREGRERLTAALSRPGEQPPAWRARALVAAAFLARVAGDYESAIDLAEEAAALCRVTDDRYLLAQSLCDLANAKILLHEYERAAALYEQAVAIFDELGARLEVAATTSNLAYVAMIARDYARAAELSARGVDARRELGDTSGLCISLVNLGFALFLAGDRAAARDPLEQSLELARDLGHKDMLAYALEGLAAVESETRPDWAARLLGGATEIRERAGTRADPVEEEVGATAAAEIRRSLGDDDFAAHMARGRDVWRKWGP